MDWKNRGNAIKTTLDVGSVIFDGDKEMWDALVSDPAFCEAAEKYINNKDNYPNARRNMLLKALPLTREIVPAVHKILDECVAALGVQGDVELYCIQDATLTAVIVPPQNGKTCILVSHSLLDAFDDEELRFVIGHELGHGLFGHLILGPDIFDNNPNLSMLQKMQFYAYKRYAELSCDRTGLLCARNYEAVVRAFFKLTSGLTHPRWLNSAIEGAMSYAVAEAKDMADGSSKVDWFSTHPYSPMRVRALKLFAKSTTYNKLIGGDGGELTEEQLEKEVAEVVKLMNPEALYEKNEVNQLYLEALAYGGLIISFVDQELSGKEAETLGKFLGADAEQHIGKASEILKSGQEGINEYTGKLAQRILVTLSTVQQRKLLSDLCTLALADGTVTPDELEFAKNFAVMLEFVPEVIDRIMTELTKPLD